MSLYLRSLIKGYCTISPNFDVFVPNCDKLLVLAMLLCSKTSVKIFFSQKEL